VASSAKRRKQLARARWERQERRRVERDVRRKRVSVVTGVIITAAVVIGAGVFAANALTGDDDSPTTAATETPATGPVDPADCVYRDTADPSVEGIGLPGEFTADDSLPTSMDLTINDENVTVDLLPDAAPCTVRAVQFLAENEYFDDTVCHRLTTGDQFSVLQCGDPTGDGTGGPGFEFDNENTDGATYAAGTVAMANSGANTNGSQFFLVYGDTNLPPEYTVFGQISSGLDVITNIAAEGVADGGSDGAPANEVAVKEVTTS
jgi:peptidyl-prolyl cis-trans isomerase B (cyclophilin B)